MESNSFNFARIPFSPKMSEVELRFSGFCQEFILLHPNCQLLAVGGWVRDKILKSDPGDIDLILRGSNWEDFQLSLNNYWEKDHTSPSKITEITLSKTLCKGSRLIIFKFENLKVDIRELGISQTISDDLKSRDFTCNCLYFDFSTSQILDAGRYYPDVSGRCIKTTNSFYSTFFYDFDRFFRLIRLKVSKKLKLDPILESLLQKLSVQKISHFLSLAKPVQNLSDYKKILFSDQRVDILKELMRYKLHMFLCPEESIANLIFEKLVQILKKVQVFLQSTEGINYKGNFNNSREKSTLLKFCHCFAFIFYHQSKLINNVFFTIKSLEIEEMKNEYLIFESKTEKQKTNTEMIQRTTVPFQLIFTLDFLKGSNEIQVYSQQFRYFNTHCRANLNS